MILGTVDPRRRAIVRLELQGPNGQQEEPVTMRLANGERIIVAVYAAVVVWDGSEKQVIVPAAGRQPLLGSGLLDAHNLNADIKPGGTVTITAL